MALKDNFKDALDDIVGMFDNPKAQGLITALSSAAKPPQGGRVAENLSVPFGATFEQGAALRGEAQQQDAQGDARAAAERQAQIEAQRVALEGRRVSTEERATQHAMDKNVLSDSEEQRRTAASNVELANLDIAARKDAESQRFTNDKALAAYTSGLDMANYKAKTEQEQNSPMYKAQVKGLEADTEFTLTQTVEREANIELGNATNLIRGMKNRNPDGVLTPLQQAQATEIYYGIFDKAVTRLNANAGPEVDIEKSTDALGLSIFMQGYKQEAVGVDAFKDFLPPLEMEKMYQLDAAWKRAVANNDFEAYYKLQDYIEMDLADDASLNNSIKDMSGGQPVSSGATGTDGGAPVGPVPPVYPTDPQRPGVTGRAPVTGISGSALNAPPEINKAGKEYQRLQESQRSENSPIAALKALLRVTRASPDSEEVRNAQAILDSLGGSAGGR
jgi:hypothetical protein